MTKQQDEVVRDRCPDIVQASGGYAMDVRTAIMLVAVMQDEEVDVDVNVNPERPVIGDNLEMGLSDNQVGVGVEVDLDSDSEESVTVDGLKIGLVEGRPPA